jgi:hypothetical protein
MNGTPSLRLRRAVLWGLVAAKILALWGLQWDIQWHIRIGRDSAWIPPHLMMYAGVMLVVLLSFGTLASDTWRRRGAGAWRRRGARPAGREMAVMGFVSTPGFHLAAWGIALTVLAAPIDDLWHRLFGIDVTLWSPPHLLGLFGSFVNTAACMLIACEVYPARAAMGRAAMVVCAGLLLIGLNLTAQQAFHFAYVHGGLAFHLFALVGTLVFPLALLTAAALTGLRTAPLLALLASMALSLVGVEIARQGFEILRPVPLAAEEIAKDPTSPIAIAQAIARKNGRAPTGFGSTARQVLSLIPVLVLVALDARRRPVVATIGYGLALLATMGWALAGSPAYAPMTPGIGVTALALALTVVAAVVSAAGARRLIAALDGGDVIPAPPHVPAPGPASVGQPVAR